VILVEILIRLFTPPLAYLDLTPVRVEEVRVRRWPEMKDEEQGEQGATVAGDEG
jgi:hypothetical protein